MGNTFTGSRLRGAAFAAAVLVVSLACGTTQGTNTTPQANSPGITDKEILIESTFPLSGGASAYATIAKGEQAFFAYQNAQGGVNGRKITQNVLDDGYDPAKTVALVRQIVTQDNAFAVFGPLGSPPNLAIRQYLNDQKVPQLFVATGASTWGSDYKTYPWTIGWQPDYVSESKIYSKDILKNHPNAKIGILYQNDIYGKDYVTGLKAGLADKYATMVVDEETYEATAADVFSQVGAIKAKGADLVFVVCTPKFAAQAVATMGKLNWKPVVYMNSVSNQVPTMKNAGAAAEGATSVVYLKDPNDNAKWGSDAGIKLFRDIMTKYCAAPCDQTDGNYVYGMAVAWTFVEVLKKMGSTLTRDNLMKQARSMNFNNNAGLLPGISLQTGGANQFPLTQEALEHWSTSTNAWTVDSTIINARA
ncbi:MAG: ABC transporter substrate-binding protein [Chloroflexota bacterium]